MLPHHLEARNHLRDCERSRRSQRLNLLHIASETVRFGAAHKKTNVPAAWHCPCMPLPTVALGAQSCEASVHPKLRRRLSAISMGCGAWLVTTPLCQRRQWYDASRLACLQLHAVDQSYCWGPHVRPPTPLSGLSTQLLGYHSSLLVWKCRH